jgi:DNA-binding transcriptional ArsR family regulator
MCLTLLVVQAALNAVSSPRRRQILRLVWDDELPAGEIASHFDVTWAAVSQNLRILRQAGLVTERRDGNRRLYRADRRAIRPLERVLRAMWEADLSELRRLAESEHRTLRSRTPSRRARRTAR